MRWRWCNRRMDHLSRTVLLCVLLSLGVCDGARRPVHRRKDTARASELYEPAPSAESLQAIAEAMGAAGFEHYTEGRPLVKRLIPADSQPDLDVVEHQGVIGKAGVDFPAYPNIPHTGFNCKNVPTGYYADLETDCQVFHICDTSRKISFLCPNGTIFSQSHLICDWWFKVDCASAPALYESSAEYYSNEQKKSQKISHSLTKNQDLQQIGDSHVRAESRRSSVNVPTTTERFQNHKQRLQTDTPFNIVTARSYQTLFDFHPTQRVTTAAVEKRRRNLVQLITNNFALPKSTSPTYSEISKTTPIDYNFREMQVAAETASFANNNNRQFLQDFHNKNYRPYPALYDIRDKHLPQETQETTKRPTLVPYTKSYTTYENQEPYTRPGVSLLKGFLDKQKNKTLITTTEPIPVVTERNDKYENKVVIETKDTFESATKIPHTTRSIYKVTTETTTPSKSISISTKKVDATTEVSYKERRERLMRKLNLDFYGPSDTATPMISTEKFFGDQTNRPGLIVPPSLTPKTLHSLAIYYATALDNLSTTPSPEEGETTTVPIDYELMEQTLPGLFSQKTINKYTNLFGQGADADQAELIEEMKTELNGTFNDLSEDLTIQQSQNPLATSPQIRELAQVFTHALSAYLQDPVQFRKVLSDIRPTHPSFGDLLSTTEETINTEPTTTVNEEDDEILGFSDDNKLKAIQQSLREGKALGIPTIYPTTAESKTTTTPEILSTNYHTTTVRNPFRCCGRISASYTTASSPIIATTTPAYTQTVASTINNLVENYTESATDYSVPRYGGFQNNALTDLYYGKSVNLSDAKPLNQYVEVTNLPTAWGVDITGSTVPTTVQDFESKRIRTSTVIPTTTQVYFTETESIELENEEELQRAHSQSFIGPKNSRQGKQITLEENSTGIKKPSEDLEAPTLPDLETTTIQTTTSAPTTFKQEEVEELTTTSFGNIFTSPDSDKTTYQQWTSNFDNWHSTVIDPITFNDNLSPTGPDTQTVKDSYVPITATTPTEYPITTEQTASSTANVEITTNFKENERIGRLLRDSSTEPAQELTTIADTVVEKAKEIMGGMNSTTTQKLMNVMKKTKSKTVKRLILLLIQTCDDDHNSTAEASKKALLEALMAVSQKDMEEIAKEETTEVPTTSSDDEIQSTDYRRMDRQELRPRQFERKGKSLSFDPSAINSLSNPTTDSNRRNEDLEPASTTLSPRTTTSRRGHKKYNTTPEIKVTRIPLFEPVKPTAEARVSSGSDLKTASDTRALELLRSLYTIAARWG
ncbi:uncharacterized protein LOC115440959 [Manduca sexta]|uniref:uncharacterized protein LOC115440959 n=1 Tax=Manduca sexta TaxID=7130 RepID=UPI00188F562C|nr:uncharacterized protein LOC115440959 [Manduca sexta]